MLELITQSQNQRHATYLHRVLPNQVREECALPLDGFAAAFLELEAYIAELPERRVDSVLSHVLDEGQLVYIRGQVTEAARKDVRRWRIRSFFTGACVSAIAAIVAYVMCLNAEHWTDYLKATIPVVIIGMLTVYIPTG